MVDDFHVVRTVGGPPETDPPLRIDPDAVLPCAISLECLQSVARQSGQILEGVRAVEQGEPANSLIGEPLERRNALPKNRRVWLTAR